MAQGGDASVHVAGIRLYIVPGLDCVRYQWSEPLPVWMSTIAMFTHLHCFEFRGWAVRENTYLSQVVRIDRERGHQIVTSGSYALVRHPVYAIAIVQLLAVPVALGSRLRACASMTNCAKSLLQLGYRYTSRG